MNKHILATARTLSDAALLSRVTELAGNERDVTVELIAHLAEMEVRKLHLAEGYGSLFEYCTSALRLSEHAAYNRIEAARVARTYPAVLERLGDGSLTLTTALLVAPLLNLDNHLEILSEAAGLSKREVEALVARRAPRSDVAPSVRKLPDSRSSRTVPGPAAAVASVPFQDPGLGDERAPVPTVEQPAVEDAHDSPIVRTAEASAAHRPILAPLAPERYRVQFTIGRETYERLRLAQDLFRREDPAGDLATIFDRGLTLQLAEITKRTLGATTKPRSNGIATAKPGTRRGTTGQPQAIEARSRHIPVEIRRKVWLRDHGRCAFISTGGRRCGERSYLEFHHVEPYAIGGETTAQNLSLRCRRHNQYEAELAFGQDEVAQKRMGMGMATRSGTSSRLGTPKTSMPPEDPSILGTPTMGSTLRLD